jgi:hypothetical protein
VASCCHPSHRWHGRKYSHWARPRSWRLILPFALLQYSPIEKVCKPMAIWSPCRRSWL